MEQLHDKASVHIYGICSQNNNQLGLLVQRMNLKSLLKKYGDLSFCVVFSALKALGKSFRRSGYENTKNSAFLRAFRDSIQ